MEIPVIHHLIHDIRFRETTFLSFSFLFSLLYSIYELVSGIIIKSNWFIAKGMYYVVLAAARFLIMRYYIFSPAEDQEKERLIYKRTGWLLLLLAPTFSGLSIIYIRKEAVPIYPGNLIYGAAAYAFFTFTSAVINLIRYRKKNRPALTANKCLAVAAGFVAIYSLQVALIAQFGAPDEALFRFIMNVSGSVLIFFLIGAIGLYLIRNQVGVEKEDGFSNVVS